MSLPRLSVTLLLLGAFTAANADMPPTLGNVPYGPAPEQRFDLYAPQNGDAPLIVMVHGGGWRRGDKEMGRVVDNKVARWLPRGIAFASINYRMQPTAAPLEQARDVARALAAVQRDGGKLGIDRDNIVLMGHSAGAHLIALLAARPDLVNEAGARPWRGTVLLDSGALDVPAIMNARHLPLYDRAFGSNPADWLAASPYQQLRAISAPILAVCSSRRANACPQAGNFVAKAQGLGTRATVLPLDKTHAEINAQLGDDAAYTAEVERHLGNWSAAFAQSLR
ncbi:alpha/beta hydrolase [Dechloromonas sp. XY25]|uniref:Alpha/beta hydrolase n=1 Tax=Dechloromonas hankyongensis TaxID=2908002 RepID=A0ABS9K0B2_9RHOO|nr:alpha/beta hydrolase [Dechloromonas hankyongensis]MCG2576577.1 alpha/beta hydrolase [Dechloromonas hankyongensis]